MPLDSETTEWLAQVRALAGRSPFGDKVKITVAVTPAVGRKLVAQLINQRMVLGGLDAQGRPTHAIEVGEIIEWLCSPRTANARLR